MVETRGGRYGFIGWKYCSHFRSKQNVVDGWHDTGLHRLWIFTGNNTLSGMRAALVLEGINLFGDVQAAAHGAGLSEL